MIKKIIVLVTIAVATISCKEPTLTLHSLQGNAFGTTYTIQYFSLGEKELEKGIDSVIYRVNRSVSTYMPTSDISKINKGDSTIVVDAIFREVYELSKEVNGYSKGFFDPTVGVLRNAYGFGDQEALAVIDETVLDSLRQYVGFSKVSLTAAGTVKKNLPEIYFDFNAVAKGYGIDRMGDYLQQQGITDFVIELGGEILAKGRHKTKNKAWTVGVEGTSSEIENRSAIAKVELTDRAMAGSGNYRKFRVDTLTGKKYVHTINPHTGLAEANNMTSATVIANNCATADAYATAFMAMGLDNTKRLLNELPEVHVYITYENANGAPKEFISGGFLSLLAK